MEGRGKHAEPTAQIPQRHRKLRAARHEPSRAPAERCACTHTQPRMHTRAHTQRHTSATWQCLAKSSVPSAQVWGKIPPPSSSSPPFLAPWTKASRYPCPKQHCGCALVTQSSWSAWDKAAALLLSSVS